MVKQEANLILSLEASANIASVAVMGDGEVLAETKIEARHGHAARMLLLVEDCLKQAGVSISEVDTILGGRGPGSFTGIRVALSAAKGLVLARNIEGYGICSLEALAWSARNNNRPIASIADSRRGSVFIATLNPDGSEVTTLLPDEIEGYLHRQNSQEEWIIIGHDAPAKIKAEPLASHLCKYFYEAIAPADKNLPLLPLYLSDPLLGPKKKQAHDQKNHRKRLTAP